MPGHNFNAQAKFTIIEEVYNKSLSKLKICSLLEHREDFWILKLQTLSPHLIILTALLDLFGSHIETRFDTPFCSFLSLLNLITWMSMLNLFDIKYNDL